MAKKLLLLFLGLSIVGCKTYVQVFETKADNVKTVDQTYVFENDSLKIIYNLWGKKGLMKFEIYNKLNVSLYIDWRKSSYIANDVKLNYWEDVERTNSLYASYYFDNSLLRTRSSAGVSTSATVKEERITFIPPKSKYTRGQFYIIPWSFVVLDKNGPYTEVALREGSKKTTKVFYKEYNKNTTPRVFRNFLTFSLTENFTEEFYVDNEFYISKILEMDQAQFYRNAERFRRPEYGKEILPYKDNRYFFINIGEGNDPNKVRKVNKRD
ncbi:MAG: hypothetical protein JJE55_14150 [Flavobacteriaceae bacterium]|nr:hypothetical protein [Flavobacteriaceae bacterium]